MNTVITECYKYEFTVKHKLEKMLLQCSLGRK